MNDWRAYDEVAETYERVRAPITAHPAADLVALAGVQPGARVLDVGTGTGVGAEAAARAAGAGLVVGVDQSPPMLRVGRRSRPALRFAAAEAIQLPFRDAAFDVVTAGFVIHMFTRYETAIFDLLRVLRAGGVFAASAWANGEDELGKTWRTLAEETVGQEILDSARDDATPGRDRFGDPARFEEALRDAGLRPVRIERRAYRYSLSREDYLAEQGTRALGRFVHEMLGDAGWSSFLDRVRAAFSQRFGERIDDSRDVLLAIGGKP